MQIPSSIRSSAGFRRLLLSLIYELDEELRGYQSVLDLGCGSSSPIREIRWPFHSVGVDIFAPAVEESRRQEIHDEYHVSNVMDIGRRFAERSVDCVIALDLIEHLEKDKGEKLIDMMETIASKKVIIFTNNGYFPQGAYDGNEWQAHRSGWSGREMQERGYRVIGSNGWKPLRGDRAQIKWRPKKLWFAASGLSQLMTKYIPSLAFQILCVKNVDLRFN